MSVTFPISRNVRLTASGLGGYLLEQVAGYLMVISLMLGWFFINLFYGIKHVLIGAVIFYFVGGTIAWILCWILYKLGCAYLGHSV
jgi:hypothetical protein